MPRKSGRSHRAHRGRVLAVLAAAALAAGCEDILVVGPLPEAGNVEAVIGAAVIQSDSGVVVNGESVLRHAPRDRALVLSRFEAYNLGGFPELDYPQSARHSLSWRLTFSHAHPPEHRGDSTIYRFHDHGEVAIAGVAMEQTTETPPLGPSAPPIRFENFIWYSLMTAIRIDWMHGGITEDTYASFHEDLIAGRAQTLRTTGSDDVAPLEATFAATPFVRLTGAENGAPLDLHSAVPVVDAGEPLVLSFDRPFDPDRAFMIIHPMMPNQQPGTRAAFIRTQLPAQRVVIPAYILRQLVENAAAAQSAYRIIMVDVQVVDDVFAGTYAGSGEPFALPLMQHGETSVHVYLRR